MVGAMIRQILAEPEERVSIGNAAPNRSRHNAIQSLRATSDWFHGETLTLNDGIVTIIGLERSSLIEGQIHRYLLLGVGILPAAAAYAIFGLIQLFSLPRAMPAHPAETMEVQKAVFEPLPMPKAQNPRESLPPLETPIRVAA